MSNTLELRSTFRLSEGMSEMPTASVRKSPLFKKISISDSGSTNTDLFKKNKLTVASFMVQSIRNLLDGEMKSILEPYVTKRLASMLRGGFDNDNTLSIADASGLRGFDLGHTKDICNKFKSKCFIRKGTHKGDVIFDMPGFIPSDELGAPDEATNFKVCSKLISISRFEKDKISEEYFPKSIEAHGLVGKYDTPMLPLIKIQTQPITARLYINELKSTKKGVDTIMLTAIKYYKYTNGKFEHLPKNGCMSITQVF